MRKWSPTSSLFRQFITHIHQKLDLLILHRAIQCHTDPMCLIHVPTGEDARFLPEGANQSGIAFEIHHTDFIIAGHSQMQTTSYFRGVEIPKSWDIWRRDVRPLRCRFQLCRIPVCFCSWCFYSQDSLAICSPRAKAFFLSSGNTVS